MSDDAPADVLGLGAAVPGPGWTVLDTARDQRFTGELVAEADATVRVYFDRGRIYVAERATDPPLGTRLVEAGALNRAQLDYGTLRIGEIEHLGRLFDRVPSVNRDGVLVLNDLMTEECVRWLAGQRVTAVTVTPYRHHPSGMHRWELFEVTTPTGASASVPKLALPAPDPTASPVIAAHPDPGPPPGLAGSSIGAVNGEQGPTAFPDTLFLDDLVEWDEPSPFTPRARPTLPDPSRTDPGEPLASPDAWLGGLDGLRPDGLPATPIDGSTRQKLTPLPVRPIDDFQLIWPSGEKDDVADAAPDDRDDRDADRVGPTARVGRDGPDGGEALAPPEMPTTEDDGPSPLAVRRAVATIDTGSLEARRRLVDASSDVTAPPGRVAVQREASVWRSDSPRPTASVFDEQPLQDADEPHMNEPSSSDHDGRANALRRLIGNLRRT